MGNVSSLQPAVFKKDAKRIARIIGTKNFNERGALFSLIATEFDAKGEVAMAELFGRIALTYKQRHDQGDEPKKPAKRPLRPKYDH